MDKTNPTCKTLLNGGNSSLPYVPVYLVGNSHLCAHHQILKTLRNYIHPNALIEIHARSGGMIDRQFHRSLDLVLAKESQYESNSDPIVVLLTFDNDLRKQSDPKRLVESVFRRYRQLMEQSPKMRFIICGIMPSPTISNHIAKAVDHDLKSRCDFLRDSQDNNVYFLSIRECLRVTNKFGFSNYFARDMVHLNRLGGCLVAKQLACTINPLIQSSFEFDPPIVAIASQDYFCYQEDVHPIRSRIQLEGTKSFLIEGAPAELEKCLMQVFGLPSHLRKYQLRSDDSPKFVPNPQYSPNLSYSVINGRVIPHAKIGLTHKRHIQSLQLITCCCHPKIFCFLCKGKQFYPRSSWENWS